MWVFFAQYIRELYWRYEYEEVVTPNIYNFDLWKTSGHAEHYKDNMFLIAIEKQEFGLKPMNCPGAPQRQLLVGILLLDQPKSIIMQPVIQSCPSCLVAVLGGCCTFAVLASARVTTTADLHKQGGFKRQERQWLTKLLVHACWPYHGHRSLLWR